MNTNVATCSATTIPDRRGEWITLSVFAALARIARDAYDRIVGLARADMAVNGCIAKPPAGVNVPALDIAGL